MSQDRASSNSERSERASNATAPAAVATSNGARAARLRLFAADGEPLALRLSGTCMVPRLDEGDEVLVVTRRFYWPGDVVAIAHPGGRVAVHRLLGYRPGKAGTLLVTRGDASTRADPLLPTRDVVGRVVGVRGARGAEEETPFEVTFGDRARAVAGYVNLLLLGAARTIRRGLARG